MITSFKERAQVVGTPRTVWVNFPRGATLGEPGNQKRQRQILLDALRALQEMRGAGSLWELPYTWRRS